jgi:hypothetical protein
MASSTSTLNDYSNFIFKICPSSFCFVLFTCCFIQWLLQLQCFNDFSNFILKYVPQSFVFVLCFFVLFCVFFMCCFVLFCSLCCFLVVCLLFLCTSYHVPCVSVFCSIFARPTIPKCKLL